MTSDDILALAKRVRAMRWHLMSIDDACDVENAADLIERMAQAEPVGWFTEDHLIDKSATTYDHDVADRWRGKGWPVHPLYAAPQPERQPVSEPSAAQVRAVERSAYERAAQQCKIVGHNMEGYTQYYEACDDCANAIRGLITDAPNTCDR